MKVLHYIPSIDHSSGGTTTYMQLLARGLGKYVELHITTHPSEDPVVIENATIHYLQGSLVQISKVKKQWQELLNKLRPDVVHINCCWMPFCALTQTWSQNLGYRVVLSTHGMLDPWIMRRHYLTRKLPALLLYQKEVVKKADYIHVTSKLERNNILQYGYNDRIKEIPNSVDVNNILIRDSWKTNKKILFLSRIHVQKGIEILLDIIYEMKEKLLGYSIIVAGEGELKYIKYLEKKTYDLGIERIIAFVGGAYGDKKWKLFQEADFFVLPTYSENFGIVIAEALASGTPVITTKGTPWEELNMHQCGWWIENDVQTLTQTIEKAIAVSEEERKAMGQRGRKLIEENYSVEIVAKKMEQLYNWILDKGEKPEFMCM